MSNNIVGAVVLLIGFSIILFAGAAAIQLQTDTGDTIIGNNSEVNSTYETMKETTGLGLTVTGFIPYLLMIIILITIAVAMFELLKLFK